MLFYPSPRMRGFRPEFHTALTTTTGRTIKLIVGDRVFNLRTIDILSIPFTIVKQVTHIAWREGLTLMICICDRYQFEFVHFKLSQHCPGTAAYVLVPNSSTGYHFSYESIVESLPFLSRNRFAPFRIAIHAISLPKGGD